MLTLRFSFKARDAETYANESWDWTLTTTWNSLFGVLAPLMINEASERTLKKAIDTFVEDQARAKLQIKKALKNCDLTEFSLHGEDFQTIKVQLRALGLIKKNEKPRSVKDAGTYWTLTPYGDEVMTRLRAIKRTIATKNVPVVGEGQEELGPTKTVSDGL